MFSLVITIIAILLVTALALATVYFGGSSFRQGHADAQAATIINESQQLRAALDVYQAQRGQLPAGTSAQIKDALIASQTLQALPTTDWTFVTGFAVVEGLPDDICLAMNKKLGLASATIPSCSSVSDGSGYCCTE